MATMAATGREQCSAAPSSVVTLSLPVECHRHALAMSSTARHTQTAASRTESAPEIDVEVTQVLIRAKADRQQSGQADAGLVTASSRSRTTG